MGDTIVIETPVATVLEVTGLQGPQGVPGASQADVLTVQGDLLYRGASAAQRLGIGTAGQILKVNSGGTAPEWGAAPAAGVSSVNGDTGAVSVTPASIDAAEANHDHQPADIYCDAAKVTATTLSAGEPNGVYFRDGSDNGKATYRSAAGYSIFWDDAEGEWVLGNVSQSQKYFIGSEDTTYPWQVSIAWTLGAQGSGTAPTVGQATLTDYQLNAAQDSVSTRVPKSGNATSTEVVLGSDTRLTNSRNPLSHAASHGPSGSDPLAHAFRVAVSSGSFSGTLLYAGESNGKPSWGESGQDSITLSWNGTKWRLFAGVANYTYYESTDANIFSATWSIVNGAASTPTLTFDFIRLGDFAAPVHTHSYTAITDLGDWANGNLADVAVSGSYNDLLDAPALGTAAAEDSTAFATSSHSHGNLTSDGKLGSTAGLPVVTTTAGAVTTLALGTANQVLRVNSGATGVEFADPAASGVTGAASSASDVLGVSGANITGVDANADRIVFWDDSESKLRYLEAGSGLTISGAVMTASGGASINQAIAVGFVLN